MSNQQQNYTFKVKVGHAIFQINVNSKSQQFVLDQQHSKIVQSNWWYIWNDQFIKNHWQQKFECMKQSSCEKLFLSNNQSGKIVSMINRVQFSNLKSLHLNGNKITNIQAFQYLNMQILEDLDISYNKIGNMKGFNRIKWNMLKELNLGLNCINNMRLSRLKSDNNVERLFIQFSQNSFIEQDVGVLIKLECNKLVNLKTISRGRIKEKKVIDCLRRKYKNIKIQQHIPIINNQ